MTDLLSVIVVPDARLVRLPAKSKRHDK